MDSLPHGKDVLKESAVGRTILWMRSNRHKGNHDLLQLLYHLRPTVSTDPKDKIYGVLGLASDALSIVPQANYEWPLHSIYATLYKTMTKVRGDLDWLTLASGDTDPAFPSWLPDLTKKARLVSMNTCRSVQAQTPFGFCAAGRSRPVLCIDIAHGSCSVDGFCVDEIDGLGAIGSAPLPLPSENAVLQPQSMEIAYTTGDKIYTAIWTTLVADQDFEGTPSSWRAPSTFGALYAAEGQSVLRSLVSDQSEPTDASCFRTWMRQNAELVFGGQTIAEWTLFPGEMDSMSNVAKHGFLRRLESTVSGRRLFTTTRGYIGIANDFVRKGDKICLLAGGRMPVVLRPTGDSHRFLGESYVHGMMLGERWPSGSENDGMATFALK